MITGTVDHHVQMDGDRSVHVIPVGGVFEIYFQKNGYQMQYAMGIPNHQTHDDTYYDLDDAFMIGWDHFELYEEDMFQ